MLLTVDIGNTSIKLGVFEDSALVEEFRLASDKELSQEEYEVLLKTLFKQFRIDGCIIASVVSELNEKFAMAVREVFGLEPMILTNDCNTGVKIKLQNPDEAGKKALEFLSKALVAFDIKTSFLIG